MVLRGDSPKPIPYNPSIMDTTLDVNAAVAAVSADNYLAVGTLLQGGRYRIERQLSSGGFGKTYVASDLTFEKTVVVKEFYIKGSCVRRGDNAVTVSQSDNAPLFDAQRTKFRKEAKRLNDLTHPNIVKVHDLFDENGTSYYTMDFVEGESLGDRVKSQGLLKEAQVMPILDQLLDALAYIHERKIWHLDLKPANVLIDAAGHVTLIDFGASKLIDNDSTATMATSTAMAYTPGYAPLEQESRAFRNFGPWTDFYALGATIYSLVVGPPIPTSSEIVGDGDAAFNFPPSVSLKLRDLIMWMMKVNHRERPQTAEEIRKKIGATAEANDKKPKQTPRKTQSQKKTPSSSVRYVKRHLKKWWWAVAAVAVVAIGVGVWASQQHGDTSTPEPPQTPQTPEKELTGTHNGHEWVDLGLPSGTLWATCNVGASSPEEYGDYFAWGEIQPKELYDWSTYFDTNDEGNTFLKYNNEGSKTELDLEDDAAYRNWGEGWRMPSQEQQDELRDECTWTWTQKNGVDGYEVESKTNSCSLFLPAAGSRGEDSLYDAGSYGNYWSRSLGSGGSDIAYRLYFDSDCIDRSNGFRYYGFSVRPVR